tara:strand:- start:248 stop:529 length:282 start_codon:yes stop_codon:yes gene_type:complete
MFVRSKDGRNYNIRYDPSAILVRKGAVAAHYEITTEGVDLPDDFGNSLVESQPEIYEYVAVVVPKATRAKKPKVTEAVIPTGVVNDGESSNPS